MKLHFVKPSKKCLNNDYINQINLMSAVIIIPNFKMIKQFTIFVIIFLLPNFSESRTNFYSSDKLTFEECLQEVNSMDRKPISDNFTGKWFEVYSSPFCLTRKSKCVTLYYSTHKDNKSVIYTKLVDENRMTKRFIANVDSTKNDFLVQTYAITGKFRILIRIYYFS